MMTRRDIVLVVAIAFAFFLVLGPVFEGYQPNNDAALVCYWAAPPPPIAVPTRPDPAGSLAGDGPVAVPFAVTSPPMSQAVSLKTSLTVTLPPPVTPGVRSDGPVDRPAFTLATNAPQEILGTLPVPPTPPSMVTDAPGPTAPFAVIAPTTTTTPLDTPTPAPTETVTVTAGPTTS